MRIGSLFDGSGTAPLAATMCGIDPVWASEIEPYPIRVTKVRFPGMLHLGDITKIDGAELVPVDIICGGSPCQDLSVAGKQAGLHNGERSHLFFEMTRIIKQMREATHGKYPRYIIWENVPGAFSSNKGCDFLAVLQAFAEIADPEIYVPEPKQKAHGAGLAWKPAGFMGGDGWSIAWRTVDAQYWGVPQRRRRIYLVADFAGECADEILFERTGMSGNLESRGTEREATSTDAGRSPYGSLCYCLQGNGIDRADSAGCNGKGWKENCSYTLNTVDRPAVAYLASGSEKVGVLMANAGTKLWLGNQEAFSGNYHIIEKTPLKHVVRRLTPLECCRLQGFPDWWENGVEGSDSARYKMWGNGMALPNMLHVMRGIVEMDKRKDTEK